MLFLTFCVFWCSLPQRLTKRDAARKGHLVKFKIGSLALLVSIQTYAVTNLERYDVNKAVDYTQTSSAAPTIHTSFQLEAFIQPVSATGSPALDNSGATITHSGGTVTSMSFNSMAKEYSFQQSFSTQAGLDAVYQNGIYDFAFSTLAPATFNPSLNLTGDNYPSLSGGPVPHFTGLFATDFSGSSLQVDNSSAYTFNWNAFTTATLNPDEYVFQVAEVATGNPVAFQIFQSATTSHTIGAGTLAAGTDYVAQIWHRDVNVHDTATLGAPSVGQSSYISRTTIQLTSVPEPSATAIVFSGAAILSILWLRSRPRIGVTSF